MKAASSLRFKGLLHNAGALAWRRASHTVGGVEMPPCAFQPEPYHGKSYEEILKIRSEKLTPGMLTMYKKPVLIHQGHKQWLYDTDGTRYLDLFAGIVTVSVGHCHPKVEKATFEQMRKLWHTTSIYMHPKSHEYAERLLEKMPGDLKVVTFFNSGSEANAMAMLLMRAYTGNWDIICHRNSYHGVSPHALGITSLANWKYSTPVGFGCHATSNPDPYTGVFGGQYCRDSPIQVDGNSCDCSPGECSASIKYVQQLQEVLDYNVPPKIAGFFAEPIQGVGGIVQYTRNFVKEAYAKVREHGGLCVSDEVQTGFGRLGSHFWGFESMDVMPDIVTCAKGMANGFPMAALITTPKIAATLKEAITFNTYAGNPMACSAALAVLDILEEENLQKNCEVVGTYFLEKLSQLRSEFNIVGDVRGKGLMIGLEMVNDQLSRAPISADRMADIFERTKNHGILLGKGGRFANVFRIQPPMCVTKEDVDFAVAVIRQSIQEHMNAN